MTHCPTCQANLGQPCARYRLCPACHNWHDCGDGWTTATDAPANLYDYESDRDALTYYLWADERVSSPSIESTLFTETATEWDAFGNVTATARVQSPQVDGGVGSVREDRLCALHDLRACLPDDEEQRVALLASGLWGSRERTAAKLGRSEHWVRSRLATARRLWRARLEGRGMIASKDR